MEAHGILGAVASKTQKLIDRAQKCGVGTIELSNRACINKSTIYHWLRGRHVPADGKMELLIAEVEKVEAEFALLPCSECGTILGERRAK